MFGGQKKFGGNEKPKHAIADHTGVTIAVQSAKWNFLGDPGFVTSEQEKAAAMSKRESFEMVVDGEPGGTVLPPCSTFQEVLSPCLPAYVCTQLAQNGMVAPMPIQAQTLPFTLRGFDVIGIAKTGSGKTMAFILPAICHIEGQRAIRPGQVTPMAVMLAPVRELAKQIMEETNKVLKSSAGNSANHPNGIGACAPYGGGMNVRNNQIWELKQGWCHVVVGTPGRMVDLMGAGELSLENVTYFVLDEADRMLEGGFGEQMDEIADAMRTDRQTLFFSATWPKEVQDLARNMCANPPVRIAIGQKGEDEGPTARGDITQEVRVMEGDYDEVVRQKKAQMGAHLRQVLANPQFKVLVFVNMKQMTWELAEELKAEGFAADFMYGGRSQDSREQIVNQFKKAEIKLLVTTDVMARGLDIPDISHVVVYDCYGGIDEYVHRIGRTARGKFGKGHALVFYEYDPKYSEMPGEMITLLEGAGQVVPPELRKVKAEVDSGVRQKKYAKKKGW